MNATSYKTGDLVTDKNYGRTCAVIATRAKSVLVALRQKSSKRTQLRWRPIGDLAPVVLQSRSEALGLACAAMRSRVTTGRTFRREAAGVGRVDPVLRLMLLRRPFGAAKVTK